MLETNTVVISVIRDGYKIPFTYTPKKAYFKNNKSSLQEYEFVTKTLKELLQNNLIEETKSIPYVVNPLSVAEDSYGKSVLFFI